MEESKYIELKNELIEHSKLYYTQSESRISDFEFDQKMKQLEAMEAERGFVDEDSPTQRPGSDITSEKVLKHNRPMLSLQNAYNFEEITEWVNKIKEIDPDAVFVIEPKYDGCSFSAKYKNGQFYQALSRGDGEYGEDLTANLSLMPEITSPKNGFTGEIRGEIMMSHAVFNKLNEENDGKYKNCRNLTSGTLKLQNPEEFKARPLMYFAYWLEADEVNKNQSHAECLDTMNKAGFNVGTFMTAHTAEEVIKAINIIEGMRKTADYDLDGAVIKVNNRNTWDEIGSTGKFPKYARAYKYSPEVGQTTVQNITFEIGRTGKITPLCWFKPILISGSEIQKATLNNKSYMENLDVRIGDTIEVCKAAEIIPFINRVLTEKRTGSETKINFPTSCPCCGSTLSKISEEHADYYCMNPDCKGKTMDQLVNYAHILEMDGFAEIVVEKLYNAGILTSIQDFYNLKNRTADIAELDRMSVNVALKLSYEVENSKKQPFYKVLAALNIRGVGLKVAKLITKKYNNIDSILECKNFSNIEGIGDIISNDIVKFFKDTKNIELIEFLKSEGLILSEETVKKTSQKLEGKKLCITGALSMPRKNFEELIEAAGGALIGSVSSKTDYLVTNTPDSGSSKNLKAQQLGITIITEVDLMKLINE